MAERLTWSRARALDQMPDRALVVRKTRSVDADGNEVDTLTSLGPYPVRLMARPRPPFEAPQGGVLAAVTLWNAYLPAGIDVQPADTMTINGESFEVSDQTGSRTDAAYTEALLRRVK
jgi:hypothetical protein